MYASFRRVRSLGYMTTVSEMLDTVHENDLFHFNDLLYRVL